MHGAPAVCQALAWGQDKEGDLPGAVRTPSALLISVFAANEMTRLQEENETLKEEVARLRGLG